MTQLYGHLILFYFTFLISHTKFHYSALRSLPWSFILLMFIVRYIENLKCPFWFTYYEIANFCQFLRLQQPYIHTLYFFYGYIGPISILKRISLQKKNSMMMNNLSRWSVPPISNYEFLYRIRLWRKKTPTLFETKTKAISTLPWHFNEFNLWNRILSLNANYLNLWWCMMI